MRRDDSVIGKKVGELTVLYRDEDNTRKFVCSCSCGTVKSISRMALVKGKTRSCGCKTSIYLAQANTTHGGASNGFNSPEYQSYIAMVNRCTNTSNSNYDRYGGKGITVQDSWLEESPVGYLNFLMDMGSRPECTTLDRIDGRLGYCKENCRWADRRTQSYNTSRKKTERSTSKYRGVSMDKSSGLFVSRIGNGKGGSEWLGKYRSEDEAAIAYNERAVEIYGSSAILNDV